MAFLTINGYSPPTPNSYEVGVMDLSQAERLANGYLNIERIATKIKLQISYDYITASTLKSLLAALSDTSYNVTYFDPQTNAYNTKVMYCGDRSIQMVDFVNGVARYKSVSFDLIER